MLCHFGKASQVLLHPRSSILPALRDQQHISALTLLTSSKGSVSHTFFCPILAQFPDPSGETELKAMLCALIQHCSESQEKKFPVNFKKICRNTCSLLTKDWQREIWLILQLCSPTMEKLQPQDPSICIPGMWLCYFCSQKRCNAAVNPVCGLHWDRIRSISHLCSWLGSRRVIIRLQWNLICFESAQVSE